ncbi:MAG: GAF domain-containing protein [Deltaproteobacteria bacterium]|nr:GAF domain-containing protein [Deltaproteobacteria bacterium]
MGVLAIGSEAENQRLQAVLEIAKALTSERDLDRLLNLIVGAASRVVDAERGTLFLVDPDTGELWSKVAQGLGGEIRLPRGSGIVGAVAETAQVIKLRDAYADPRFNQDVDRSTGYRTRNLLAVPLRNTHGDVVGVLQLLNKHEGDFSEADADLLRALGGQAAAAIENALLHDEITKLFEGFVQASVVAIESRDPSTAGHSERVSRLTLGLADAVEHHGTSSWSGVRFAANQRMEIRYAALLHDFGKVGVREAVLVKAEKLYPQQLEILRMRLEFAKKTLEVDMLRECLQRLQRGDQAGCDRLQADFQVRCAEIDRLWQVVQTCNMPTVLPSETAQQLADLAGLRYRDAAGEVQPLLAQDEIAMLSIPRGTLSATERYEIESHVSHTFRFLSQIPWSRALRRVPDIAHRHHEKLNGRGYPLALQASDLAIEPRMMAIADIYDALTASDRPYKRAVPHGQACKILVDEAKAGALDGELVALFCETDVAPRSLVQGGGARGP